MSRRSKQSIEAESMYRAGAKLVDIAKALKVPEGTVRRWKSTQGWDSKKEPERSGKKANVFPNVNPNVRGDGEKISSFNNADNGDAKSPSKPSANRKAKTNSQTPAKPAEAKRRGRPASIREADMRGQNPKARYGNTNAADNRGGPGAPPRNDYAVKTGEFQTIYADQLDEDELAIYDSDHDTVMSMVEEIKFAKIRSRRIMRRINDTENTTGGMVFDSVTKTKENQGTRYGPADELNGTRTRPDITHERDNSIHVAKPAVHLVMSMEEALTRVQKTILSGNGKLHDMIMKELIFELTCAKTEDELSAVSDNSEGGNFLEALEKAADEVWDDEPTA